VRLISCVVASSSQLCAIIWIIEQRDQEYASFDFLLSSSDISWSYHQLNLVELVSCCVMKIWFKRSFWWSRKCAKLKQLIEKQLIMIKSCKLISDEYMHQTIENQFQLMLRTQQIDTLHLLLKNEKNVILIIKIKFEKSIIFQIAFLMFIFAKTALIIMSLNALKNKQCKKLKNISDWKLFVLNEDSYSSFNITLIHQESFTHHKSSV